MPFFAVTTAKGPKWQHDRGIRDQPEFEEHARYFDKLVEDGVVVLGGPIESVDEGVLALLAVEADDEEDLKARFACDPWVSTGTIKVEDVRPWAVWLDGRTRS